jgi:Phosphomannose isomerase
MELEKKIYQLDNPRVWRTYTGGKTLDELHGKESPKDDSFPEEWIMSVVEARNVGREEIQEGLSQIVNDDVKYLRELIASNPEQILGKEHYKKQGKSLSVLVKLIDSSERLTIQVHPDRETAQKLFHSLYGKTECWQIIGKRTINGEEPCVYLGFKEGVTRKKWQKLFEIQDIEGMLSCLHCFPVEIGDTILIKGGVPHAIGGGCFLVEIQEPTDYTIRVEKITPSGVKVADEMCHQGLGFERMFDCFHYETLNEEEVRGKYFLSNHKEMKGNNTGVIERIRYEDTPLFKMNQLEITENLTISGQAVFFGLYILQGKGIMNIDGIEREVRQGQQYFVPANTKKISFLATEPIVAFQFFGSQ